MSQLENFEKSFTDPCGGFRRTCKCGKIYYNPDQSWTIEEGELEELQANPDAFAVDYTVGTVEFEGNIFANPCNCWHPRAMQIIRFIDGHKEGIAKFLTLEKKRLQEAADDYPTVK